MQIATWNVNSLKVRLPHLLDWLEANPVDVIGIQETKTVDEKFPEEEIIAAGYHVAFAGQKTYNGVCVLSKHPIEDIVTDLEGIEDPQRRVLGCTINGVRIYNLYFPNGQALDSDKFHYKINWLEALHEQLASEKGKYSKRIVMGDFNITPADADVHAPEEWFGKIHSVQLNAHILPVCMQKVFTTVTGYLNKSQIPSVGGIIEREALEKIMAYVLI